MKKLLTLCVLLFLLFSACDTNGGDDEGGNSGGNSGNSSFISLTAYPADGGAWLAWQEDTNASGYEIYYGAGAVTEAQKAEVNIEYPRAGIATASLNGVLENDTRYNIWVKAINSGAGSLAADGAAASITPQSAAQITTGTYSITEGGIYKLPAAPDDTQTVVSISTADAVTITGGGTGDGTLSRYALERYSIRYTVPGANLIIRDIYIYIYILRQVQHPAISSRSPARATRLP